MRIFSIVIPWKVVSAEESADRDVPAFRCQKGFGRARGVFVLAGNQIPAMTCATYPG